MNNQTIANYHFFIVNLSSKYALLQAKRKRLYLMQDLIARCIGKD